MTRIVLLVGLAVALFALLRWFINAPAARVAVAVRRIFALLLLALAGFLAVRGAPSLAVPLALAAFAMLRNTGSGGAGGARRGRRSQVSTRLLRMELDHDSGRMEGEVLAGAFAGRLLSGLEDGELDALWRECAAAGDQSLRLLRAWAERERPDWLRHRETSGRREEGEDGAQGDGKARGSGGAGASGGGMSVAEAREVLGVGPNATEADIRAAHRRLMKAVHPDRGGSDWLARRINEARDVLLAALGEKDGTT